MGGMWQKFQEWRASARRRETAAYETYSRHAAYPLFALGLLFVIAFAITLTPDAPPTDKTFARIVIPLTWAAFAIDYAIGVAIAPNRLTFMRTHLIQGAALIFPPLRLLLLFHIFHVLRTTPLRRGDRARTYVLYLTTLLLVFGAILVVYFERKSPEANITSFGNALWWGGETVSTVGYGDFYPVTVGGRLVASVLFVNGVALLSVITAGLAQNFNVSDAAGSSSAPAASATAASATAPAASAPAAPPAAGPPAAAAAPAADAVPLDPSSQAADMADAAVAFLPLSRQELDAMHARLATMEHTLEHISGRIDETLQRLAAGQQPAPATGAPASDTPASDTPGSSPQQA